MPPFSGYRLWLAVAAVGGAAALPPPDDRPAREEGPAGRAAVAAPAADPPTPVPMRGDAASLPRLPTTEGKRH